MGGFGSGGARVRAGRKPKDAKLASVHGSRDRGTRPPVDTATPPAETKPKVLPPPRYLSKDQKRIWKALAAHAHAQHTLTKDTEMAFADLCEAIVLRRKMAAQLEEDGLMVAVMETDAETGRRVAVGEFRAHPLISKHQQQLVRVNDLRARFRLSPDGKERAPASSPKPKSALEQLQARAATMRRPVGVQ